jgi:hypothetical protein
VKKLFCTTKNDKPIYLDIDNSHVALHLKEYPDLLNILREVLSATRVEQGASALELDLNRPIGFTTKISTNPDDKIVYAKRKERDMYARFVVGKKPKITSKITVILNENEDGFTIWSAWVGDLAPSFPGGENENAESKIYWSNNALIYNPDIIQSETITEACPWE